MLKAYHRFAKALFWTVLIIVYALAIMPAAEAPKLGAGDKVDHIAAFATLTLLARGAYRHAAPWRLAVGLSLFGALIELTQAIPFLKRDASAWDWAADTLAILVVLAAGLAVERRRPVRARA